MTTEQIKASPWPEFPEVDLRSKERVEKVNAYWEARKQVPRVVTLMNAMNHQFDDDENAELSIPTDDPVLQAAVRVLNRWGAWNEVELAGPDLIELIEIVLGAT